MDKPARSRSCSARRAGRKGHHLETCGERLELQRDVGCRRDEGDQRHHSSERRVLAEPRRDQIGDRGDVVDAPDSHQLAQEHPPAGEDDGGSEIDGDELHAARRCRTDRAEEGPGGAVDRDRKRVDKRRGQPSGGVPPRPPVPGESHAEQDQDIGEADDDDEVDVKHQRRSGEDRASAFSSVPASISTVARLRASSQAQSTMARRRRRETTSGIGNQHRRGKDDDEGRQQQDGRSDRQQRSGVATRDRRPRLIGASMTQDG